MTKQISLLLENTPGRLTRVTELLAKNNINIRAMAVNETSDFSILRLIVTDREKAVDCLKAEFTVSLGDILLIELEDRPGALYELANALGKVNIEYLYPVISHNKNTTIVALKPEKIETAIGLLKERFRILDDSSLSG